VTLTCSALKIMLFSRFARVGEGNMRTNRKYFGATFVETLVAIGLVGLTALAVTVVVIRVAQANIRDLRLTEATQIAERLIEESTIPLVAGEVSSVCPSTRVFSSSAEGTDDAVVGVHATFAAVVSVVPQRVDLVSGGFFEDCDSRDLFLISVVVGWDADVDGGVSFSDDKSISLSSLVSSDAVFSPFVVFESVSLVDAVTGAAEACFQTGETRTLELSWVVQGLSSAPDSLWYNVGDGNAVVVSSSDRARGSVSIPGVDGSVSVRLSAEHANGNVSSEFVSFVGWVQPTVTQFFWSAGSVFVGVPVDLTWVVSGASDVFVSGERVGSAGVWSGLLGVGTYERTLTAAAGPSGLGCPTAEATAEVQVLDFGVDRVELSAAVVSEGSVVSATVVTEPEDAFDPRFHRVRATVNGVTVGEFASNVVSFVTPSIPSEGDVSLLFEVVYGAVDATQVVGFVEGTVRVVPLPDVVDFRLSDDVVCGDGSVSASWTVLNAVELFLEPVGFDLTSLIADGNFTLPIDVSGELFLRARNRLGDSVESTRVILSRSSAVSMLFGSDRSSVSAGGIVTLGWQVTPEAGNAVTLAVGDAAGSVVGTVGSAVVAPLTDSEFVLSSVVSDALGRSCPAVTQRVSVSVVSPGEISVRASEGVTDGEVMRLDWGLSGSFDQVAQRFEVSVVRPGGSTSVVSGGVDGVNLVDLPVGSYSVTVRLLDRFSQLPLSWGIAGNPAAQALATDRVLASAEQQFRVIERPVVTSFSSTPTVACGATSLRFLWGTEFAESALINGLPVALQSALNAPENEWFSLMLSNEDAGTFILEAVNEFGFVTVRELVVPFFNSGGTLVSDHPSIIAGDSTTLRWQSSGSGLTTLQAGDDTPPTTVTQEGSLLIAPLETTTYTLAFGGGDCPVEESQVTVIVIPVVIESFAADPVEVTRFRLPEDDFATYDPSRGNVTLSWLISESYSVGLHDVFVDAERGGFPSGNESSPGGSLTASTEGWVGSTTASPIPPGDTYRVRVMDKQNPPRVVSVSEPLPVGSAEAAFITAFNATPAFVCGVDPIVLTWVTRYADESVGGVTALNGVPVRAVELDGVEALVAGSELFTLTASNRFGAVDSRSLSLTRVVSPVVSAVFSSDFGVVDGDSLTVPEGAPTTLVYEVSGASSLSLNGVSVPFSGGWLRYPSEDLELEFRASVGASGSECETVRVIRLVVEDVDVVNLRAVPDAVTRGERLRVSWDVVGPFIPEIHDLRVSFAPSTGAVTEGVVENGGWFTPESSGRLTVSISVPNDDGVGSRVIGSASVDVEVVPEPVLRSFTVSPAVACVGDEVRFSWDVVDAAVVMLNGVAVGDPTVSSSGEAVRVVSGDAGYHLVVRNRLGFSSEHSLLVRGVARPIGSLSVSESVVSAGGEVLLSWVSEGADRVFLNDAPVAPVGSMLVTPLESVQYSLRLESSACGAVVVERDVSVVPVSVGSFVASRDRVTLGESVSFSWLVNGFDGRVHRLRLVPSFESVFGSGAVVVPASSAAWSVEVVSVDGVVVAVSEVVFVEVVSQPVIGAFSVSPVRSCGGAVSRDISWVAVGNSAVLDVNNDASAVGLVDTQSRTLGGSGVISLLVSNELGFSVSRSTEFISVAEPTVSLTVSDSTVAAGSLLSVSWVSDGLSSGLAVVNADVPWPPSEVFLRDVLEFYPVGSSGVVSTRVWGDSRVVLVSRNDAGGEDCVTVDSVLVDVVAPSVVSFGAVPSLVSVGGEVSLSWVLSGFDADSMVLWLEPLGALVSGSGAVVGVGEGSWFQLVIRGSDGVWLAESDVVWVSVVGEPSISFVGFDPSFSCGAMSSVLSWSSVGASGVWVLGSVRDPEGSLVVPVPESLAVTVLPVGVGGSGAGAVARAVVTPFSSVDLVVSDESVLPGESVRVGWVVTDADRVWLDGLPVGLVGERVFRLGVSRSFVLRVEGPCGVVERVVSVEVPSVVAESFVSDAYVVSRGDSITLSWNLLNVLPDVHSITLEPNGTQIPPTGNLTIAPTDTTHYSIIVRDATNAIIAFIQLPQPVTVVERPIILSFATETPTACGNTPTKIFWNTQHATHIQLNGITITPQIGSTTRTLTEEATFTLTASNAAGATTEATLTIPHSNAPNLTVTTSSTAVNSGEFITLTWSADENAIVRMNNDRIATEGERSFPITTRTLYAFQAETNNCPPENITKAIDIIPITIDSFTANRTRITQPNDIIFSWTLTGFDPTLHDLTLTRTPLTNPTPTVPLAVSGSSRTLTVNESSNFRLTIRSATTGELIAETNPGVTITLDTEAHITFLNVTPAVACGDSTVRVDYFATNSTNVTYANTTLPAFGSFTLSITGTQTITLTPIAPEGTTPYPRSITVPHTTLGRMNFTASTAIGVQGETIILSWEPDDWTPNWVTLNGARVPTEGSTTVKPLANSQYVLQAGTNAGCVTEETETIIIEPLTFGAFTAAPNPVTRNSFVTLELRDVQHFDARFHELYLDGYGVIPSGGFGDGPRTGVFVFDLSDCVAAVGDSCVIPISLSDPIFALGLLAEFDGGTVWRITNHTASLPETCESTINSNTIRIDCSEAEELLNLGFITVERISNDDAIAVVFDSSACTNAAVNQNCRIDFVLNNDVMASAFEISLTTPIGYQGVSFDSSFPSSCEAAFSLDRVNVVCREPRLMRTLGGLTLRKISPTALPPVVNRIVFVTADLSEVEGTGIDVGRGASFVRVEYWTAGGTVIDLTRSEGRVPEGIYFVDGVLSLTFRATESKRYQITGRLRSDPGVILTTSEAVIVTVADAPRIISFTITPTTYCVGDRQANLVTWVTEHATNVFLDGFDVSFAAGVLPYHPKDTELRLVAENTVGSVATVIPVSLRTSPQASLTASPNPRIAGEPSIISWFTTAANDITLNGATASATGTFTDTNTITRTITVTASNDCGTTTHELLLETIPVSVTSLTADETNIQDGVGTTLRWTLGTSFNPQLHSVWLMSSESGNEPINVTDIRTWFVTPSDTTTFWLHITTNDTTVHESSSVTVTVDGRAAIVSFTATPAFVCGAGDVSFGWVTRNAVSVSLAGAAVSPLAAGTSSFVVRDDRVWSLVASDALGRSVQSSVRVPVVPQPMVRSFSFTPSNPVDGMNGITVSWVVDDASTVMVDGALVPAVGSMVVTANSSRVVELHASSVVDGRECSVSSSLSIPVTPVSFTSVTLSNSVSAPGTLAYRVFPNSAWVSGWGSAVASGVSRSNLSWVAGADAAPEELRWLSSAALVEYVGWLFVPEAGWYDFVVSHDDEFELVVNDVITLRKSSVGAGVVSGSNSLPGGWVSFRARARLTNVSGLQLTVAAAGQTPTAVPFEALGNAAGERSVSWVVSDSFDPALHSVRVSWLVVTPDGERVISKDFAGSGSAVSFAGAVKSVTTDVIRSRNGTVAASVTRSLTTGVNPSISSFSASPTSVCAGSAVSVSWVSSGLSSLVSFTPFGGLPVTVSSSAVGTVGFVPVSSGTLRVHATGSQGFETVRERVITVTVQPTVSFSVSPSRIKVGESSVLSWSAVNAETVLLENQSVSASGTIPVSPLTTVSYELTTGAGACSNVTRSVTLVVDPVAVTNVVVSPARITLGESSTVSWSTSGFDAGTHSVELSGAPSVISGVGAGVVTPESVGNHTITVSIVDGLGRTLASRSALLEVVNAAVIDSFTVSPSSVCLVPNGSTNVNASWLVRNAVSVRLNGTTVAPPANVSDGSVPWRISAGPVAGETELTTVSLTASNSLGSTVSRSVVVPTVVIPAVSFAADKQSVVWGEVVTLSWSTADSAVTSLNDAAVPNVGSFSVALTESTTFSLSTRVGDCAPVTSHVTVTVTPPLVTSFSADRTNVNPNDPMRSSSVLSWGTQHVNASLHDVLLMPSGVNVTGTNSRSVTPTVTTTYRIRVTAKGNPNVVLVESSEITVSTSADPVITSFVSTPTVACGVSDVTLSWVTVGAAVTSVNGVTVTPAEGGSVQRMISQPSVFTLSAVNAAGTSVTRTLNVGFATPSTTSFSSTKSVIARGESVTLSWSTTQATSVLLDGVSVPLSGGTTRSPTATTSYVLTTRKDGCEDITSTVTVTVVNPSIDGFAFVGDKDEFGSVPEGSTVTLGWSLGGFDVDLHQLTLNGVVVSGSSASGAVAESTSFTLRVLDRGSPPALIAERSLLVPVRPVVVSFGVPPVVCSAEGSVALSWVTRHGAVSLVGPSGSVAVTASGSVTRLVAEDTLFSLSVVNSVGSFVSVDASVEVVNVPVVSLVVSPENPPPGGSVTVSWVTEFASVVSLDGVPVASSGSTVLAAPVNAGESFSVVVEASNDACGSVSRSVVVGTETNALSGVSVNPSSITLGDSAFVSWVLADGVSLADYRVAVNPNSGFGVLDAPEGGVWITPSAAGLLTVTVVLFDRVSGAPVSTVSGSLSVAQAPVVVSFAVNPTNTCVDDPLSVLSWLGSGGVSYAISNVGAVAASGTRTVDSRVADDWIFSVTNALGVVASEVVSTVLHPTPTLGSLVAPASVALGDDVVVRWVGDVAVVVSGDAALVVPSGVTEFLVTPAAAGEFVMLLTPSNAGCVGEDVEVVVLVVTVPSVPLAVSAAVVGDEQVRVSWLPPASDGFSVVTNYVVERRTNDLGWLPVATVGNVTEWVDSTVVAGNSYRYRVTARNAVGDSPVSAASDAVVAVRPPAVVSCTVSTSAAGQLTVTWVTDGTNERPVDGFVVVRDSLTAGTVTRSFAANARSVTDSDLVVGETVTYDVSAVNSAGVTSVQCSAVTLGRPGVVSGVTLTATVPDTLSLSWLPPTLTGGDAGLLTYDVEVRVNPNPNFSLVSSDASSPLVTSFTAGDTVTYRVRARNPVGVSDWVTSGSVLVLGAPPEPTNLMFTAGDGTLLASWSPPTGSTARSYDAFDVEWFVDDVSAGVLRSASDVVTRSLSSVDVPLGSSVTFRVRSVNTLLGSGFVSGWVSGPTEVLVAAPAAPTVTAAVTGNGSVRVEWVAAVGSVGRPSGGSFVLQERVEGGAWVTVYSGVERSFVAVGLVAGRVMEYRARESNAVGLGDWSAVASVTVINAPGALSNCVLSNANGVITIAWTSSPSAAQPVASVIVRRGGTLITTAVTSPTVDGAAPAGTSVTYTLQPQNAAGLGPVLDCGAVTPTLAPAGNAECSSTVGNGSLVFAWSDVSSVTAPISSYRIFSVVDDAVGELIQETTSRSVTVSGLVNGVVMRVRVFAVGSGGVSEPFDCVGTPFAPPASVSDCVISVASAGTLSVSWVAGASTTAAPISRTEVTYGDVTVSNAVSPLVVSTPAGVMTSFSITNVGSGGMSAPVTCSGSSISVPPQPTSCSVDALDGGLRVGWVGASSVAAPVALVRVRVTSAGGVEVVREVAFAGDAEDFLGLVNGVGYDVQVSFGNAVGFGLERLCASGAVPVVAPTSPSSCSVSGAGFGALTVGWVHSGADGYRVSFVPSSGATVVTSVGDVRSVTTSGLVNTVPYVIEVRSVSSVVRWVDGVAVPGGSVVSVGFAECSGVPYAVPAAVEGCAVAATVGVPFSLTVSWVAPVVSASAPRDGYVVTRSGGSTGTVTSSVAGNSFTVGGLVAGTTYTFSVTAVGPGGSSAVSQTCSARAIDVPNTPSISVTQTGVGELTVSWSVSSTSAMPADSFWLERSTDRGASWTRVSGYSSTVLTELVQGGLLLGTRYDYRVRAENVVGVSAWRLGNAVAIGVPGVPRNVTVTPTAVAQLTVSWQAPSGSDANPAGFAYDVQRSTSASGPWTMVMEGTSALSFVNGSLTLGTTYWYRVRNVNMVGAGEWSAPVSGFPLSTVNATTGIPSCSVVSSTTMSVAWTLTMFTNATHNSPKWFDVEWKSTVNTTGMLPRINSGSTLSVTHSPANTTYGYQYRVRGGNELGAGSYSNWSNVCSFSTPITRAPTWTSTRPSALGRVTLLHTSVAGAKDYEVEYQRRIQPQRGEALTKAFDPTPVSLGVVAGTTRTANLATHVPPSSETEVSDSQCYEYQFRVRGRNDLGAGPWSSWSTMTRVPYKPPMAPSTPSTLPSTNSMYVLAIGPSVYHTGKAYSYYQSEFDTETFVINGVGNRYTWGCGMMEEFHLTMSYDAIISGMLGRATVVRNEFNAFYGFPGYRQNTSGAHMLPYYSSLAGWYWATGWRGFRAEFQINVPKTSIGESALENNFRTKMRVCNTAVGSGLARDGCSATLITNWAKPHIGTWSSFLDTSRD
jgi:hypothetical protein